MARPDAPLTAGTMLGKYQVLRLLAVGGMAEIYLARATGIAGFEKAVVLKRICPHLVEDPEFVAMFLDEARLTATLGHPNVVQVYDVDRVGQSIFFTMEFVHGRDLGSVLSACAHKKRGLSLSHALHVVREVASGLHYAHDKKGKDGQPLGTVHRDVSPNNVMITYEGLIKIVDFGIAKAAVRQSKTKSGMVKGTVLYMSPEQAQGHDLDRRSDVFSLGILLYELTTGARPFRGPSDYAVLHKLINEDAPPPTTKRPSYPPELERIVLRALSRNREGRYPTAGALRDELEAFMRDNALTPSASSLGAFMRELFDQREDTSDLFALPPLPSSSAEIRNATEPGPASETGAASHGHATTGTTETVDATQTGAPKEAGAAVQTGAVLVTAVPEPTPPLGTDSVVIPVRRTGLGAWLLIVVALVALGGAYLALRSPSPAPAASPDTGSAEPVRPPARSITSTTPAPSAASPAPVPVEASAPKAFEPSPPAANKSARPRPPISPLAAPPAAASAAEPKDKPKWNLDSPLPP